MPRSFFLIVACLPGFIACGGSSSNTGDGGAKDGGDGGGPATVCSTPDYTQGDCSWPEFCQASKCVPAQNLNAQGMDIGTTQNPCVTAADTIQGMGNLDVDRATEDAGLELFAPNSPVITYLTQVPITQDSDCAMYLGHNSQQFEESTDACGGGNTDAAGMMICAAGEAAVLFQGDVYDPRSHFKTTEGPDLDGQFYWMVMSQPPINFNDTGVFGAAQSGYVIPGTGWSASGGPLLLVQCLGKLDETPDIRSYPNTLHFADTGVGDAGIAGNSYCTGWMP